MQRHWLKAVELYRDSDGRKHNEHRASGHRSDRKWPSLLCPFLKSLQGKRVEMGHHSGGNIHALRLTTGSVCVCVCVHSWLGRWCVCVA